MEWYERKVVAKGEPFDGQAMADLALVQWPLELQLSEAFTHCRRIWHRNELYSYFMRPNELDGRWRFAGNRWLAHPELGTLLVDLVHDERVQGGIAIGGMEYMDRVLGWHKSVEEWLQLLKPSQPDPEVFIIPVVPAPMKVVHVRTGARRAE